MSELHQDFTRHSLNKRVPRKLGIFYFHLADLNASDAIERASARCWAIEIVVYYEFRSLWFEQQAFKFRRNWLLAGPDGLDYSDAFFARAKFCAAAKNEKYRSARRQKLQSF